MSKNNWIFTLLASLAIAGCGAPSDNKSSEIPPAAPVITVPAPVATAPKSATPHPAPPPKLFEEDRHFPAEKIGKGIIDPEPARPHIPARAFCLKNTDCGSEYAAYGYIIFTSRPTDAISKQRYLSVCHAFIGTLEPVSKHSDKTPKSEIATTFWLLDSQPENENSCEELVERYDYARAAGIATALRELSAAGPLLVAWGNPYADQSEKGQRLLIDLSRLPPNELNNAFLIWRDNISQDQRFLGKKFNIGLARIEFRNFIEKYGESILKIVKLA